jgi:hypothetical protein
MGSSSSKTHTDELDDLKYDLKKILLEREQKDDLFKTRNV